MAVELTFRETILAAIENHANLPSDIANLIARQIEDTVSLPVDRLELVDPVHLSIVSDGRGQYPDGYHLTQQGAARILESLCSLDSIIGAWSVPIDGHSDGTR